MKIKDYVRTKNGIERITDIKEWVNFQGYEKIITTDKNQYKTLYEQCEIIKSSPNIIDLIEVGDYVNGNRVDNIAKEYDKVVEINLDAKALFDRDIFKNEDIKSIVTKQQFESMEYKINE